MLTFADCRRENNETRFDFYCCLQVFFCSVREFPDFICVCVCVCVCWMHFLHVCVCVCVCVWASERCCMRSVRKREREREEGGEACSLGGVMQARILVLVAMATGF